MVVRLTSSPSIQSDLVVRCECVDEHPLAGAVNESAAHGRPHQVIACALCRAALNGAHGGYKYVQLELVGRVDWSFVGWS
jgi:hypothetical protein